MISKYIEIVGLVQGVGFRPFIYRAAKKFNLCGTVENTSSAVKIYVQGSLINKFVDYVKKNSPPASKIHDIIIKDWKGKVFNDFSIIKSEVSDTSQSITQVSPDIAVCDDCLSDMINQKRRPDYPFTNCTNCGPRFSIIKSLPYDRHKTTMEKFQMCSDCESEYTDILDRRFHAQPISCWNCGPIYTLISKSGIEDKFDLILEKTSKLIDAGGIITFKGMGGFNLACDALNAQSASRLRKIKKRDAKPFAVMFKDVESLRDYAHLSVEEIEFLQSWQRPITIVQQKENLIPKEVTGGFKTIGAFLPYMPIHYQLFERLNTPALVLTSANLSNEPILIENEKTEQVFIEKVDAVLTNDREIYNRVDDSVGFIVNGNSRLIRRSRGFAPTPIISNLNANNIFAAGAELTNTFAIGKGNQIILSQHIGDIKNYETYNFYVESFERFSSLFEFKPEYVVCDKHPDYLSTKFAKELGLHTIEVQHHHAHIASVLAENNFNEKVIGVCLDGTGLGDDGNIWGSEFLLCNLTDYERKFHFDYIPMPGGDKAASEPWRFALSLLFKYGGEDSIETTKQFFPDLDDKDFQFLIQSIIKKINTPLTCGAGRYFDAVSALLGLVKTANFHAEAPMRLEDIIDKTVSGKYEYEVENGIISFSKTFEAVIHDKLNNVPSGIISAKWHNTVIDCILKTVKRISADSGINMVALSGGVFQNKYILGKTENELEKASFRVLKQTLVPSNDAGISLGQIAIAAAKMS